MLKRHGCCSSSSLVLKRHRCSSAELLPHDVVELILERLPVTSLRKFMCVSKQWKSTIESQRFKERHLIRRRQSRSPDIIFVSLEEFDKDGCYDEAALRRKYVVGSSTVSAINLPPFGPEVCHGSCDGLLCFHGIGRLSHVVNPVTRWYQSFPASATQQLVLDRFKRGHFMTPCAKLGFGKDKLRGTYKPVWLHNSFEYGLDNITTCEVFDFTTNAWRHLVHTCPVRIISFHFPVYLDGSLYWFTECEETKIVSLDLHTETFQVISKTPFPHVHKPWDVNMGILDNCLCVSQKKWPTQDIWSFYSSGGSMTWKKLCSIDLYQTYIWLKVPISTLLPVVIVDGNKLLLQGRERYQPVIIYDLQTKSYDLLFKPTTDGYCVHYFASLFSALSN